MVRMVVRPPVPAPFSQENRPKHDQQYHQTERAKNDDTLAGPWTCKPPGGKHRISLLISQENGEGDHGTGALPSWEFASSSVSAPVSTFKRCIR